MRACAQPLARGARAQARHAPHTALPPCRNRRRRPGAVGAPAAAPAAARPPRVSWRRPRRPGAAAAAPAAAPEQHQPQQQQPDQQQCQQPQQAPEQQDLARIAALVAAAGLDVDAALIAAEAAAAHAQLSRAGALPPGLGADGLAARALALTRLLATGSTFRTLEMVRRAPALLSLPPGAVAARVLGLKLALPASNLGELLFQRPSLLLLDDAPAAVSAALARLTPLMPGIPVAAKLHEGGTVFWSFVSVLSERGAAGA
ncbi:hypothetical protein HT031_005811 [Scenedesmus sp. PABB004]|nr:hypothetical protein HT031_005811 [Scenedesmus sp. PABB004]